jgi:glycosyltransferase involved in cell wall biosynthesis
LSFLFNWPSTGGGIVHTVELVDFLGRAGFETRHLFARKADWGIGRCDDPLPYEPTVLQFTEQEWDRTAIQERFRQAVRVFDPDHVIITDSWNMKPVLAEAVREFPYILRLQAQECLCPLNNLRLLPDLSQCANHQLASPETCAQCLLQLGDRSGGLHQAERALAGVGTAAYRETLRRAFAEAEATLVVNPLTEAMIGPFARNVRVVTSGFNSARFPWPWPDSPRRAKTRLFMAGLVDDLIKGFHVLHEACSLLWRKRQDFELCVTGEPVGKRDEFTEYVGWISQADLPRRLREADVVVVPTIAQDGLGRTAVEAMGVGRPVIASRLGGLLFTVSDGAGLLFEPGNAGDLAAKIESLLDSPELRQQMGLLGRKRFEEQYTWEAVIEKHYAGLLRRRGKDEG